MERLPEFSMSEPKRYSHFTSMQEDDCGEYVHYSEWYKLSVRLRWLESLFIEEFCEKLRSDASTLLKHAGKWEGNDAETVLREIKKTRR